jgi:hypothetical protein
LKEMGRERNPKIICKDGIGSEVRKSTL